MQVVFTATAQAQKDWLDAQRYVRLLDWYESTALPTIESDGVRGGESFDYDELREIATTDETAGWAFLALLKVIDDSFQYSPAVQQQVAASRVLFAAAGIPFERAFVCIWTPHGEHSAYENTVRLLCAIDRDGALNPSLH